MSHHELALLAVGFLLEVGEELIGFGLLFRRQDGIGHEGSPKRKSERVTCQVTPSRSRLFTGPSRVRRARHSPWLREACAAPPCARDCAAASWRWSWLNRQTASRRL